MLDSEFSDFSREPESLTEDTEPALSELWLSLHYSAPLASFSKVHADLCYTLLSLPPRAAAEEDGLRGAGGRFHELRTPEQEIFAQQADYIQTEGDLYMVSCVFHQVLLH